MCDEVVTLEHVTPPPATLAPFSGAGVVYPSEVRQPLRSHAVRHVQRRHQVTRIAGRQVIVRTGDATQDRLA